MTDNNEIISAYDSKQTQAPVNGEQLAAQASQISTANQQDSQSQMQASTSESSPPNHSSMPGGRSNEQAAGTSGGLAGASGGTKTMGFEDALDYTVNQSTDSSLKPGDKRTVNYLVHRMIWDQQEKIDLDDRAISKDGTMEVQDSFDIEQSGLK